MFRQDSESRSFPKCLIFTIWMWILCSDYRYPYTAPWGSGGGTAPASNLESEGSRHPLVPLQPEAAPQVANSLTGNQSPFSVGVPSVAAGSSPSYEPHRFVNFDSGSNKPYRSPAVPMQSAGDVSPPDGTEMKTPSFSEQPQPAVGTGGNLNLGSVYEASLFAPSGFAYPAESAGNMAPGSDIYHRPEDDTSTEIYSFGDGPVPYGSPSSAGSLGWVEQPAGGASFYEPSSWIPSRSFPDFSVWDSESAVQQSVREMSPLPPSSYIIQSRNGYQRAREVLSHTKYSPEYPEPPVFPVQAVKAPSKSPPVTFPKIRAKQ